MIRQLEDGTYEGLCDFVNSNREFCNREVYMSKEIIEISKVLGNLVHCDNCTRGNLILRERIQAVINANKLI